MRSFRTELENPIVEKDIIDLEAKIRQFKEGDINEENFEASVWHVVFMVNANLGYR